MRRTVSGQLDPITNNSDHRWLQALGYDRWLPSAQHWSQRVVCSLNRSSTAPFASSSAFRTLRCPGLYGLPSWSFRGPCGPLKTINARPSSPFLLHRNPNLLQLFSLSYGKRSNTLLGYSRIVARRPPAVIPQNFVYRKLPR